MTSGAIRVPPPSRPTKKQGITTHLTPRHSRRPEPVETTDYPHETETVSHCNGNNSNNNSNNNGTVGSSMDAPLSPPRSMIGLLRNADASDPSVLSPREASASDHPSSPVSSYQVPASFRLHHRHTSGSKRSRSASEKENAHNITTTVAQLFSGGRNSSNSSSRSHTDNKNDRSSTDSNNSENAVPYDWTVNVDQLSAEKQTKLYWNLCYGGAGTTDMDTDMDTDTDTFGANIANNTYSLQDSWSARRLPPPKGCLSTGAKKKQRLTFAADRSGGSGGGGSVTNTNSNSNDPMLSPVPTQPSTQDTFSTPKSSPADDILMPRVTSSHNRTVKFGPPSAVEFEADNPAGALTPVPAQVALKRFPVENQEEDVTNLDMLQQTKDNSAVLAEWDDSFSIFEDDEEEDGDIDIETSFDLPAPPSRKRERRSSAFFSPSDGSTGLLDYSSDDDNMTLTNTSMLTNTSTITHDDPDSSLDMPMMESLSVQSPPLDVSLQSVNRSGAAALATSSKDSADDKSPDDVREWYDGAGRRENHHQISSPADTDANSDSVWNVFQGTDPSQVNPETWSNAVVFGSLAVCDHSLYPESESCMEPDNGHEDEDEDTLWVAPFESHESLQDMFHASVEQLENYTSMLCDISPENQAAIASQLAQHPELQDMAQPIADSAWCKVETNLLETLQLQLEGMEDEIRASELRLECNGNAKSRFSQKVLRRLRTRLVEREVRAVQELEDALRAESDRKAMLLRAKQRRELLAAPVSALMHQATSVLMPLRMDSMDGNEMRFVFQHGVEGVQTHIVCDHLGENLRGEIHSDASNCFLDSPAVTKTHVAADFHRLLLKPTVDYHCSNNVSADVSDTCLHLATFLGRVDLATIDLMRVADLFPVSITSDDKQHVVVSVLLPRKTTLKVSYDTHSSRCRNWSLPSNLSLWQNSQPVKDVPEAVRLASKAHGVELRACLLQQVCDCMLGVLAQYVST